MLALVVGLLAMAAPLAAASPAAAAVKTASGDLSRYVDDFASTVPRAGTEGYDRPTSAEASGMASAYRNLQNGALSKAAKIAGNYRYDVVRFTHLPTSHRFDMLVERPRTDGTYAHAWGLYVRAVGSASRLSVEVAHPIADLRTETIGTLAFLKSQGADLFIAGAHRRANADGSADVAHRSESVFQAVHNAAAVAGDRVLQPHGYADTTVPSELVISSGSASPSALASAVAGDLSAAGFTACLFKDTACSELGATTNVQGQTTRAIGADFLHMEMARRLRDDFVRWATAVEIVTRRVR